MQTQTNNMHTAFLDQGIASSKPPKLSVAPLIDIVMLLICFYILVARSAAQTQDEQTQPSHMQVHLEQSAAALPLVVNIRADGSFIIDAQPVDETSLIAQLKLADGPVVIRADRRQMHGLTDKVMGLCRQAGRQQFTLRFSEGGG